MMPRKDKFRKKEFLIEEKLNGDRISHKMQNLRIEVNLCFMEFNQNSTRINLLQKHSALLQKRKG